MGLNNKKIQFISLKLNVWNSLENMPTSQWISGKKSFKVKKATLTSSDIKNGCVWSEPVEKFLDKNVQNTVKPEKALL
uniref:Uncharacterized protein n=1 Tax=Vespula pensylvanica TaxID=30213 RepID=A0A834JQ46_VESPE|nr:hypothetical protein H0235_017468 [Vespula pensylvanica]